jgi:hypothetical protein
MKKLILILFVILAMTLGGTIAINSAGAKFPPPELMVNIATCPSEDAYIFDGWQWWALKGGAVSNYYNRMTIKKFLEETERAGSPADLKQCPPANGNMRNSMGDTLNIPMGWFDDEDNWFTQEEFDKIKEKSRTDSLNQL